jgi:hypothetical protein
MQTKVAIEKQRLIEKHKDRISIVFSGRYFYPQCRWNSETKGSLKSGCNICAGFINRERLELVDKYKKCMEKAEKDKEAEYESYLKAAEALK